MNRSVIVPSRPLKVSYRTRSPRLKRRGGAQPWRAFTKLMGTFWDNDAGSKIQQPPGIADAAGSLQYPTHEGSLGALPLPLRPCGTGAQHRHRPRGLPAHSFIAFPPKRVPKMPLSGVSTRSGDLARLNTRDLAERMKDSAAQSPGRLELGRSGSRSRCSAWPPPGRTTAQSWRPQTHFYHQVQLAAASSRSAGCPDPRTGFGSIAQTLQQAQVRNPSISREEA